MFCLVTDPAGLARILKWWQENRQRAQRGRAAELGAKFVAHYDRVGLVVLPPPGPPETYDSLRHHNPE